LSHDTPQTLTSRTRQHRSRPLQRPAPRAPRANGWDPVWTAPACRGCPSRTASRRYPRSRGDSCAMCLVDDLGAATVKLGKDNSPSALVTHLQYAHPEEYKQMWAMEQKRKAALPSRSSPQAAKCVLSVNWKTKETNSLSGRAGVTAGKRTGLVPRDGWRKIQRR